VSILETLFSVHLLSACDECLLALELASSLVELRLAVSTREVFLKMSQYKSIQ
jgi:hypothetical protein